MIVIKSHVNCEECTCKRIKINNVTVVLYDTHDFQPNSYHLLLIKHILTIYNRWYNFFCQTNWNVDTEQFFFFNFRQLNFVSLGKMNFIRIRFFEIKLNQSKVKKNFFKLKWNNFAWIFTSNELNIKFWEFCFFEFLTSFLRKVGVLYLTFPCSL